MQTPTIQQSSSISQPSHTGITLHLDQDSLVLIGCLIVSLVWLIFGI